MIKLVMDDRLLTQFDFLYAAVVSRFVGQTDQGIWKSFHFDLEMVAPALPGAQAAINIIKCGIERLEIVKQNQDMAQHLLKNVNEQEDELEADIDRLSKSRRSSKHKPLELGTKCLKRTRVVWKKLWRSVSATKDLVVVLFRAGGQLPEVLNRDNKKVIKQKLLDFCKAKTVRCTQV
eukprot:TRINITY_DN12550_c0_g1_i3.p3 TRINITY_DN12550_c0_g1~~TRINITY_DN12550_c0_g1_i3.p3  ORF type:complete len:177 (-),score=31.35 TRINITY_DN12550_c0_g1_i3:1848-2378(-)